MGILSVLWLLAISNIQLSSAWAEESLPNGVPATTIYDEKCFVPSDEERARAELDAMRITIPGCTQKIIAPTLVLDAVFYKAPNSGGAKADCAKLRENKRRTARFINFEKEIVAMADSTFEKPDSPAVLCVAEALKAWALKDAMTKVSNTQAEKTRTFITSGIGTLYLKHEAIRKVAATIQVGSSNADALIRAWLGKLAWGSKARADEIQAGKNKIYPRVNTQFWRAYSMLPAALLNGDEALLLESRGIFKIAMKEIRYRDLPEHEQGFLPHELDRMQSAQKYHAFGLEPITAMALLSMAYGCDFMDRGFEEWQVARLMRKTLEGYFHPKIFEEAVFARTKKKVTIKSKHVTDTGPLLALAHEFRDTIVEKNVRSYIARNGNDAIRSDGSFVNLGGRLSTLAKVIAKMKDQRAPLGLRRQCR